jgi:hypothetical protein
MTEEDKIAKIARAAHTVFIGYCKVLGDYSFKDWDEAEQWQRDDTIALVKNVLTGEYSAEVEHGRWKKGKELKGYVWGAEKNDDPTKGPLTNPNMKPYAELPMSARMKDHLLIVVALGVAAHYGVPIAKDVKLAYV